MSRLSVTVRPLSIGQLEMMRSIEYTLRNAGRFSCVLLHPTKTVYSLLDRGLLETYMQGVRLTAAGSALMEYVKLQDAAGRKA